MPNPRDRKRLKDRIIDSISKAVKQIQRLNGEDEDGIVLTNDDWQFQKLVEHLDHALLHGLKNITNGYWVLVKEFTPKTTVKEIDRLTNVTTNLGKGRAWLYITLGDHLLESYVNCYINNQARVKNFYMKEALVLDQDQMQVLLTTSMGLEYITFRLDADKPYLDLASHVRLRTSSVNEEEDSGSERLSLASYSSQLSLSSCHTAEVAIDAVSVGDFDAVSNDTSSDAEIASEPFIYTEQSTIKRVKKPVLFTIEDASSVETRIDRISSIQPNVNLNSSKEETLDNADDLQVIRHKVKVAKTRKKRGEESSRANLVNSESLSSINNENAPLVTDTLTVETANTVHNLHNFTDERNNIQTRDIIVSASQSEDEKVGYSVSNKQPDTASLSDDSGTASHMSVDHPGVAISVSTALDTSIDLSSGVDSVVEENCCTTSDQERCSEKFFSHETSCVNTEETSDFSLQNLEKIEPLEASFEGVYDVNNKELEDSIEGSVETITPTKVAFSKRTPVISDSESSHISDASWEKSTSSNVTVVRKTKSVDKQLENLPNSGMHRSASLDKQNRCRETSRNKTLQMLCPWDIKVDNNTKLLLMLEVFQNEEEHLIKLFSTCLGHTEGNIQPVLLVLTDRAIYLTVKTSGLKFKKEAIINFDEIDYISLSVGYQVLNIVCTNRRKQFWITTGDSLLTKCIMGHLDNAIRHSERDIPRLTILTDATNQRIALQKWAAAECQVKKTEVNILHYSLVYWEELETGPQAGSVGWVSLEATKQGLLYYKSHDSYFGFGPAVWKRGYFVLRDGTLFLYREKKDKGQPVFSLNLTPDDCGGCRMNRNSDRPNCLEILLTDGRSLLLSSSSLPESQQWLQSLCQAVAQNMGAISGRNHGALVPCCCVLTDSRLFLCHEDVQTGFLRTLAAQNVMDIASLQLDPNSQHFCLLCFNAPHSAEQEQWVVYFNCGQSRDGFLQALEDAWRAIFHSNLVKNDLENGTVLRRCHDQLERIRQVRAL